MGLILPSIQTRQPQQGPKLNRANLITKGADVAFVRLDQPALFGSAKLSKLGSPSLIAAGYGIGTYFANTTSDGFNTSGWPVLADGTEYTYLVVAQLTATGTTDYLINGDNTFRAFQFRIETTGAPTLIGFNTAVSTFAATGTVMPIGEAQAIGARYTATEVAIFQKGIKTASSAASGTIKGQTASDIQIAQRLGNNLHGSIGLVIRWPRGLSDAELKWATANLANTWQLVQASQHPLPVEALAGTALSAGATANSSASASITTQISLVASAASPSISSVSLTAGATALISAGVTPSSASASLTTQVSLSTSATAPASASSTLATQVALAADSKATTSASSSLTTQVALSASATSASTASASLATQIPLTADARSPASAAASLTVGAVWTANASISASAAASLTTTVSLGSSAQAPLSASAALTTAIALTAAAVSKASADAALTTQVALAAVASAAASSSAQLATSIVLSATASVPASASAAFAAASVSISASASTPCSASAALTTMIALASAGASSASAMVALMVGGPIAPNPRQTYIGQARIRLYTGQKRVRQL